MPHPRDDLPKLFRSLGPDDADFQANAKAAAREVEQRWPLFRAISPKKPVPTPALTEQERQRWTGQEQSRDDKGVPALTRPGLADKLASSLSKMSGRMAPDTSESITLVRAGAKQPSATPMRSIRPPPSRTETKDRGILASFPTRTDSVMHERPTGLGLFETPAAADKAAARHQVADAPADQSLKGVFSRLEGAEKEKVIANPVAKRSTFLGRLGRR